MTGALNEMAAREHMLDLLCEAEQQRLAGGVQGERTRLRRAFDAVLARRRRRSESPARGGHRGRS